MALNVGRANEGLAAAKPRALGAWLGGINCPNWEWGCAEVGLERRLIQRRHWELWLVNETSMTWVTVE